jgi:hypothetical protein
MQRWEGKTGISDYQIDFHRFSYTGNVAANHLIVACVTKFENHRGGGLTT